MTTPVAPPSAQLHDLDRLYRFHEQATVLAFIEEHPALLPLLSEAPTHIAAFFPDPTLYLEVSRDAEEESFDHLTLHIVTALAIKDALAAEDRFYVAWGNAAILDGTHSTLMTSVRSPEALAYL